MTPKAVDNSSDTTPKQSKPLRSALRSTEPKVTQNDVPSKSAKNKSTPPMSARKVDRIDTALEFNGGGSERAGGMAADGTSGGTTLLDLKRQRAQSRRPTDGSTAPQSSVVKSTSGGVGNGDVLSAEHHEHRLRLTSPEFVAGEEKRQRSCCVII